MDVSDPDSVRTAVSKLSAPIDTLYAGSEGARGVEAMGMDRPDLKTSSVDEFASIIDGFFFGEETDPMQAYAYIKYTAAQWMSSEALKNLCSNTL